MSVPLVIGVSGHRNLVPTEIPEIRQLVRQFLQHVQSASPDTPVTVMAPLAEGAGLLVGREAVELGLRLIVPLPMPRELYLASFEADDAREEFEALASHAEVFELPLAQGNTLDAIAAAGPARDRQYAQLGVYLSGHCHILLTLWDGKPSDRLGGTAQVVQYHHTDFMPGLSSPRSRALQLIVDYESDLVYHIVCSRDQPDGTPAEGFQPLQAFYLTADIDTPRHTDLPEAYRLMFQRTGEFNRDAQKYNDRIDQHENQMIAAGTESRLPRRLRSVAHLFQTADWLGSHFRKRVNLMLRSTYTIAVLMGLAFIAYSDVAEQEYMIYVFLLLFATGFVIFLISKKRDWHRKYLDYRALAEGLRVQFFWLLAGVRPGIETEFAHDNFLQKQAVEVGWIRNAMRVTSIGWEQRDSGAVPWGLDYTIDHWIGSPEPGSPRGQIGYFESHARERLGVHSMTELLGRASLWTGIAVTIVLAIYQHQLSAQWRNTLIVLMGILPLVAAIREAYGHKKADKELIKQYRFMHRLFCNACDQLRAAGTDEEKREVLHALGDAALDEHAEWILMHRERPLEHSKL